MADGDGFGDVALPVFDAEDLRLVGWESGPVADGDWVLQARCGGCGTAHALKLPPGTYLIHHPSIGLLSNGVAFMQFTGDEPADDEDA